MSAVLAFPQQREQGLVTCLEAEMAVLGAILVSPDAFFQVSGILHAEYFAEPAHRSVYETAAAIVAAGQTPTFMAIRTAFGPVAVAADLGGVSFGAYLARLASEATTVSFAIESAREVRAYWALRRLQSLAAGLSPEKSFIGTAELAKLLDQHDEIRARLGDTERKSISAGNAAAELVRRLEAGTTAAPISTGLISLDRKIGGGLRGGKLLAVAGRTSMGKSILGVEIAERVADQGCAAIYHTLEMGDDEVAARMISSRMERRGIRVPFTNFLGASDMADFGLSAQAAREAESIAALPHRIEHAGGVTIGEITATSERRLNAFAKRGIKPGVIVIDHAHLVGAGRHYQREDEKIREITNGCVALAKRTDCAVVLLAQLNRQVETQEDKRPGPKDLRGSGSIEEDVDTLIFLYREAYYVERSPGYRAGAPDVVEKHALVKNSLELIVDKNRQGMANQVVRVWIDPALNAIRDRSAA